MIKYFCDRCGKEIVGNVNKITDTMEAIDSHRQKIIATWKSIEHICDECQQEELTCGFKVGDEVITDDGRVGTIESICDCEHCKKRGFYEPRVEMKIGSQIYITDTDKNNGFISYYKIGDRVFGNIDDHYLLDHLKTYKEAIKEIEAQLNVIRELKR